MRTFDLEERDHPLVLRYDVGPDWLKPLGLPPAPLRFEQGQAQIAAIAVDKARDPRPWVSYSRNKNHYQRRGSRYDERPDLYSYSIVPPAVDTLTAAGFLENIIAPPDPYCGWQSAFRAMPALIAALGAIPPPIGRLRPRALIQLRDKQEQLIDFRDTELTHRKRCTLVKINEAIVSIELGLPADIGERRGDFLDINGSYVNLGQKALRRIFIGDFKHGGRFYGAGFQSLPKEIRRQLTIGGEPVAEPDYPAHHLNILYALEGLSPTPDRDHYDVDGYDRSIVKRVMLILINALTRPQAMGAITYHLDLRSDEADRLINELKQKHKPIESYFHSGAGCRLQRLDSDMAERVLLDLFIHQGVPVLPIHDSFIVLARHEGAAREKMVEAFQTVISRARGVSRITKSDQKLKTKTTYTMVSSSLPPSCSLSVLFDPERRLTPLGRIVTLNARRRRALGQEQLANLIGIGRSTLSNILSGRFGASPQTAERITEVIATTPAFER